MEKRQFFEPAGEGQAEIEVKKSRFLGRARLVSSVDEARLFVREERAAHPAARHVVYAFILGGENSETSGMSDDGEPKKTAGRPVMEVVKGSGVRNVLLTVTRYFGGTKLGTGGLVRAYTECAQAVLQGIPLRPLVAQAAFTLTVPYESYDGVKRMLTVRDADIRDENFSETIQIQAAVREEFIDAVEKEAQELTRGRAVFRRVLPDDTTEEKTKWKQES